MSRRYAKITSPNLFSTKEKPKLSQNVTTPLSAKEPAANHDQKPYRRQGRALITVVQIEKKMGCVSSKPDINDQHPNIFQVSNVNDQGDLVSPGQLEVTETELVLYQRGKNPTIWPLRSLRKYGFDSEIFSFECGRRCPTGQGIYAFRCRKAEQLFNIVQHHIVRNSSDENPLGMNVITPSAAEFPLPASSTGPPVQRRIPSQPEGYLNPVPAAAAAAAAVAPSNSVRPHPSLSRPGSITSNGPVSPTAASPPPPPLDVSEHNNNKRGSLVPDHAYTNSAEAEAQPNYANLGLVTSPTTATVPAEAYITVVDSPCHLYMNIDTTKDVNGTDEDARHCYANIDTKDLEHLRPILKSSDTPLPSVPQTPTALYLTVHEVNYAELDLDTKNDAATTSQITPDSPNKAKKSYATIDFQKTNALSQSINPPMEVEEGSRKTRHNSTISDVTTTRHSNSLSD